MKMPFDAIDRQILAVGVSRIADNHQLPIEAIMGRGRSRRIVAARYEAIKFVFDHTWPTWSYPDIGAFFGRDHTTILHALGKLTRSAHMAPRDRPRPLTAAEIGEKHVRDIVDDRVQNTDIDMSVWGT